MNGIHEVEGSIPFGSTKNQSGSICLHLFFFSDIPPNDEQGKHRGDPCP
jgi:hypothetical protein